MSGQSISETFAWLSREIGLIFDESRPLLDALTLVSDLNTTVTDLRTYAYYGDGNGTFVPKTEQPEEGGVPETRGGRGNLPPPKSEGGSGEQDPPSAHIDQKRKGGLDLRQKDLEGIKDLNEDLIKDLNARTVPRYAKVGIKSSAAICTEIIEYLNMKTGAKYRVATTSTRHIRGRLAEGYTIEDFKTVIDNMCVAWLNHPVMNNFVRPQTLFCGNFDSYLHWRMPDGKAPVRNNAGNSPKSDSNKYAGVGETIEL